MSLLAVMVLACAQEAPLDFDVLRTESGDTLGMGRWRLTFWTEYSEMVDGGSAWVIPGAKATVAVGDWADAGVSFDMRTIGGGGDFGSSGWEAGDMSFYLKAMPWDFEGWKIGGAFEAKLPSAGDDDGVGTDEGDLFGRLVVHRRWDDLRVSVNAGMALQGDNSVLRQLDTIFLFSAAVEGNLGDGWRLMGELAGAWGGRDGRNLATGRWADDMVTARLGLVGPIADTGWDWGVSAEAGITSDAPDYVFGLAATTVFGEKEPVERAHGPRALQTASRARHLELLNPLETDTAETIPSGQGVGFLMFRGRKQADATMLYSVPRVGGIVPLGPWADLTFHTEYTVLDGKSASPPAFSDAGGFGDTVAELKLTPLRLEEFTGGGVVGGKFPLSNKRGITTGEVDVFAKLVGTFFWDPVRLHLNAGLSVQGDPTAAGDQNDYFLYSSALEWAAMEELTVLAELAGSGSSEKLPNYGFGANGAGRLNAGLGFLGPISHGWTWTAFGTKGVTSDSPDWEAVGGVSYLFGE